MDIDKLLLKVMNNEATREEHSALEQWKNESQENIQLLQELAAGQAAGSSYQDYDKEAAWNKVNSQLTTSPKPSSTKPNSNSIWYIIAVLAGLGLASYFLLENAKKEAPTLFKADTEVLAFALQDKSNIWLRDGGSTLSLESDFQTERRVALEGEAFFDVAPDSERPFIIEIANDDFIKVVGTSFNVINDSQDFDLNVYSGTVELHTLNRVLTLTKGDRVTRINGAMVKVKNNNQNLLSWKTQELVFENSSLSLVFEAIQDYYKVNIQLESDGTIANCRIRTRYTQEPITKVMEELSEQFNFQYEINTESISVTGLSCP